MRTSFFFDDTATTEIYTLSLHDALPILCTTVGESFADYINETLGFGLTNRSEEHTSELQSHVNLVCRLLLEKKKVITFFLRMKISIRRLPRQTAIRSASSRDFASTLSIQ